MTTKSEIISAVSFNLGQPLGHTKMMVDATFDAVIGAIACGDQVKIHGLGTFDVVSTEARVGRNPRDGSQINIPAGKKIKFKAAADLKSAL